MPPCNKELNILDTRDGNIVLTVKCCQSEGHEGRHEWHLWTDGDNQATGKKGVIKVID